MFSYGGSHYVALSTVKHLSSLEIGPMTFDRLKQIRNSKSLRQKRQEEEQRLKKKLVATPKESLFVFFPIVKIHIHLHAQFATV